MVRNTASEIERAALLDAFQNKLNTLWQAYKVFAMYIVGAAKSRAIGTLPSRHLHRNMPQTFRNLAILLVPDEGLCEKVSQAVSPVSSARNDHIIYY